MLGPTEAIARRKSGPMGVRKRSIDFYVYRIFNEYTTVYVGKGSLQDQQSRFKLPGEVIEKCRSKLAEFNCEQWGVSKTDLARLRVVAAGG